MNDPSLVEQLFEAREEAVVLLDAQFRILSMNPSAADLYQLSESLAVGKPFFELIRLPGLERHRQLIRDQIPVQGSYRAHVVHGTEDADPRWVDWRLLRLPRQLSLPISGYASVAYLEQPPDNNGEGPSMSTLFAMMADAAQRGTDDIRAADLFDFCAAQLGRATGATFVSVNEFQSTSKSFVCRSFFGIGPKIMRTIDLMGQNPVGRRFPASDERLHDVIATGRLQKVPGGLHELTLGQIPAPVCATLEHLLDFGDIYVMGLKQRERVIGTFAIAMRNGQSPYVPVVESLGRLMAVLLVLHESEQARLALSAAFEQSQRMEALGRLAGGIIHDFNNLLTGIVGNISLAISTLPESDPQRDILSDIEHAATHASELTRQMLLFARQQPLQMEPLDLNDVILRFEKILRRLLVEPISLTLDLAPDLPNLMADASQIEQVLANLVINARDAISGQGRIVIRTRCDEPGPDDLDGLSRVRLDVEDNGAGMDADTREHIFEPFFSTKARGKGTGLGLATVSDIVAQLKGRLHVESEYGYGSRFIITWPGLPESAKLPAPPTPLDMPRGSETILLVEDDKLVRELSERILARLGYRVLMTESAQQALSVARTYSGTIDLLVSDIVMPDLNGRELAERLVADHPRLKVLLMSGYTEGLPSLEGVPFAFLAKPFTPPKLAKMCRALLDGQRLDS